MRVLGQAFILTALACSPPVKHAPVARAFAATAIWATSSMAKVTPADPPGSSRAIRLYSAKNEFESAQVHIRATGAPGRGVRIVVSDLVGPARIAASDIAVSLEGYVGIDRPSAPGGLRGRVPDVLVPERDTLTGETRSAFPFEVPAGETRSVWIDVFVRPEIAAGDYAGEVRVVDERKELATLPISLHVWNFTLPSTATLPSFFSATPLGTCTQMYGSYDGCAKYPGAEGNPDRGVELSHVAMARLLLDHRVSYAEVAYAGSAREGWPHFDHVYDPLIFGTAPTRLKDARLTTIAYVGAPDDAAFVHAWHQHAKERHWDGRLVYYQCDEPPRTCSFERVKQLSANVPFTKLLTTDIKTAKEHALLDGIDILVPNVAQLHPRDETNRRGEYSAFASRPSKRLWWYQDCSQHGRCSSDARSLPEVHWPSYMVDASPVQNRVFQWLAFAYGVSGELYYQVDRAWSHDPFTSVFASEGHGDGTLVYPGVPARIGGTSPTILSSIRLEHIRDGFEDYEYLAMFQGSGERAFADEVIKSFIESSWRFSEDPEKLLAARIRLGERLDAKTHLR
jgi:hypothetical protein